MKTVSVPGTGTQVAYDALGEGPGLALLHGTSLDPATNFGHVTQRLSARRRVITPEYGGCGLSTIPPGPLSLEVAVEQIAAALGDAFDGPVDLVGESLGAVVAAATAARYPGLVRHLILVAGWASSADPRHQLVFGTWKRLQQLDCELANRYIMPLAISPAFLTELGDEALVALAGQPAPTCTAERIDLDLRIDLQGVLDRIQGKTLIIQGRDDQIIPDYQTVLLRAHIPDADHVVIPSGHAIFAERPDDVCELVNTFLSR